ncbi:MAG: DUF4870 domain-containing protein [Luteitalea sp.]|nr:DUF4870 domain-containing protein [Luteitalea sp.]
METSATEKSSTGLEPNLAAALGYLFIIGIVFLVIEKESKFVRFHAMQSTALLVAWVAVWMLLVVFGMIPVLGWLTILLWPIVGIVFLVVWILCIVKAFQAEWFRLPILGDFSATQVGV